MILPAKEMQLHLIERSDGIGRNFSNVLGIFRTEKVVRVLLVIATRGTWRKRRFQMVAGSEAAECRLSIQRRENSITITALGKRSTE